MSAFAQCKTFLRENYIKETPYGTGRLFDPKGVGRKWDGDAYRLAVENFLTTLGPSAVISVNVIEYYAYGYRGMTHVWYWVGHE